MACNHSAQTEDDDSDEDGPVEEDPADDDTNDELRLEQGGVGAGLFWCTIKESNSMTL